LGDSNDREVALLVDTFSNHFAPETAHAALELLLAGGYRVHIVRVAQKDRPLCCGRTYLSNGLVEEARAEARRTVGALLPYVRKGMPIIGLEPSCLLMLRDEYYALGLGNEVNEIGKAALLLEEFLAREYDTKQLKLAFKAPPETHAIVHGHCHQKAFGAMKPVRKLLNLVSGLTTEFIESSCCGMAGAFGYEAEHYQSSLQMAELSLLPSVRQAKPDTWVVANGISCQHQIRDGAQRESVHLAQVLRAALDNPAV
jgi:Fe-S oxidoreductase